MNANQMIYTVYPGFRDKNVEMPEALFYFLKKSKKKES